MTLAFGGERCDHGPSISSVRTSPSRALVGEPGGGGKRGVESCRVGIGVPGMAVMRAVRSFILFGDWPQASSAPGDDRFREAVRHGDHHWDGSPRV